LRHPPSLCPLSNTWPQFCVDAVGPQKNIVASLSHLQCKLVLRLASCTRTPRGQTSQSDSKKRSEPKSTPSKSPRAIPYWRRPSWAALGDLPIESNVFPLTRCFRGRQTPSTPARQATAHGCPLNNAKATTLIKARAWCISHADPHPFTRCSQRGCQRLVGRQTSNCSWTPHKFAVFS
jgi:hypothetical protein